MATRNDGNVIWRGSLSPAESYGLALHHRSRCRDRQGGSYGGERGGGKDNVACGDHLVRVEGSGVV